MTIKKQLTWHTDPGHGWMEVPLTDLVELGIDSEITVYSYMNETHAFLEEDCDAPTYHKAAKKAGWEFLPAHENDTNGNSPIRSYKMYTAHEARRRV